MKKIYVVFLFLTFSLFLPGCSAQINPKLSSDQNMGSNNRTQQVINESANNTITSGINNPPKNTSNKPIKKKTPQRYTMKDIETYFAMNRQRIIKLFGSNYSEGTLTRNVIYH